MKKLLVLFITCCSVHANAQSDSIKWGKYFIGFDIVPVMAKLTGDKGPEMFVQLKWVSSDPCLRYRASLTDRYRDGQHLLFTGAQSSQFKGEDYTLDFNKRGAQQLTALNFGAEKVIPRKWCSFLYGADLVVGRREETQVLFLTAAQANNDSVYDEVMHRYGGVGLAGTVASLFTGLAPFVGAEKEIGEHFSIQASVRTIAGYNFITRNDLGSFAGLFDVRNKFEAQFTGINLLLFYRF